MTDDDAHDRRAQTGQDLIVLTLPDGTTQVWSKDDLKAWGKCALWQVAVYGFVALIAILCAGFLAAWVLS